MEIQQPLGQIGQNAMSEEEMRGDIERSFEDLKSREGGFQAKKIANQNQFRQLKIQIIQRLLLAMKDAGIDPGDPSSVRDFMVFLQEQDPDLYAIFELAMNDLLPDDPDADTAAVSPAGGEGAAVQDSSGLMDKYKNLQSGILRQ